eukprot:CAMPEP_0115844090 /NCGR_PEP_ID=MMETSP0287-20121206/8653_1 /TAXON_ID=412157 /ORGANISM="Chrysochromulina rotalis, Strain UIO044" /LENGTH=303 /DNA_ID=CAMNT_0003297813 /DNA_START=66 /DNA_END=973 /DNA_ORIENTATION=-
MTLPVACRTMLSIAGSGTEAFFERRRAHGLTPREMRIGEEYWGSFSRSLFTLFQTLTGESWSEAIARPLVVGYDTHNALVPYLFFSSFILLVQVVLLNAVVAVLLDGFSQNATPQTATASPAQVHSGLGDDEDGSSRDEIVSEAREGSSSGEHTDGSQPRAPLDNMHKGLQGIQQEVAALRNEHVIAMQRNISDLARLTKALEKRAIDKLGHETWRRAASTALHDSRAPPRSQPLPQPASVGTGAREMDYELETQEAPSASTTSVAASPPGVVGGPLTLPRAFIPTHGQSKTATAAGPGSCLV